nr:hypothetical protein CFP56_33467 [Quercus suber]
MPYACWSHPPLFPISLRGWTATTGVVMCHVLRRLSSPRVDCACDQRSVEYLSRWPLYFLSRVLWCIDVNITTNVWETVTRSSTWFSNDVCGQIRYDHEVAGMLERTSLEICGKQVLSGLHDKVGYSALDHRIIARFRIACPVLTGCAKWKTQYARLTKMAVEAEVGRVSFAIACFLKPRSVHFRKVNLVPDATVGSGRGFDARLDSMQIAPATETLESRATVAQLPNRAWHLEMICATLTQAASTSVDSLFTRT